MADERTDKLIHCGGVEKGDKLMHSNVGRGEADTLRWRGEGREADGVMVDR